MTVESLAKTQSGEKKEKENPPFRADLIISYLTVRFNPEGERKFFEAGQIDGKIWTPDGDLDLTIKVDNGVSFMETQSLPRNPAQEITGYKVSIASELFERLKKQQIVGAEQAQGITLRQVRILPTEHSNKF